MVFEVGSRGDGPAELREKTRFCLKNGTPLVVLVDPYGPWVRRTAPEVGSALEPLEVPLDPGPQGFRPRASQLFSTP
ncbi:PDDEXK family nuclease [Thermus sediminis]|uniref:Uma2 family endonuclease n=1 Tax=Thermus sediminis TaxID=1761908 RepID=UPI001E3314B7|nr:Uma2 family endonuclease [Thermus sediminis]